MLRPLDRSRAATTAGVTAAGLILLRVAVSGWSDPLWGLNALSSLGPGATLVWTVLPLIALIPFIVRASVTPLWEAGAPPLPAWLAGALFLLVAMIFPAVAIPLLGDGIDRLEATLAGGRGLIGQPAPLDLLLHLGFFQVLAQFKGPTWETAWRSWRLYSFLAGALSVTAVWKLASFAAVTRGGRVFVTFITLAGGALLFFFGYVENYVGLAAGLHGFYLLILLSERGRAPRWSLWAGLIGLIGLHYFMALLVPALGWALYRRRTWRPSRVFIAVTAIVMAGFGAFVLSVIDDHYGGLASIFVPPEQWLGGYHLLGFFNQQLLACPAWPILLALALWPDSSTRSKQADRPGLEFLISFLGAASLILLVFFFFLRPVIGPAADWDLFAVPSLAYAPWLALRVLSRWEGRPDFVRVGWAAMVMTAAFTGPWLSANQNEPLALQRYRDALEWEAGHNPWAASYGYLRLGKYLGRRKHDQFNPEIVGSLERAVTINPDSAALRMQVAQAYSTLGRMDEARREMAAHHRLMGAYYERKGRPAEALLHYRAAIEEYGDTTPATIEGLRRVSPFTPPTMP